MENQPLEVSQQSRKVPNLKGLREMIKPSLNQQQPNIPMPRQSLKAKEELLDEDEDMFLKELEKENKMLEEELKTLQNAAKNQVVSSYLPKQQEGAHSKKNSFKVGNRGVSSDHGQRKIRFQDEAGKKPRGNSHERASSFTPGKD